MISFGAPENGMLLWLLLPLGLFLFHSWKKDLAWLKFFGKDRIWELMQVRVSQSRFFIKSILWLMGCALLISALARPRFGFDWREDVFRGTDIVVVLDLSTSMLATDILPSRL